MKLTKDQVKHVAKLANLPFSEEEEDKYSKQLSKILDYVEQLNQVDTSDAEPTFNVSGSFNKFRTDETSASLSQEEALQNASKKRDAVPAGRQGFFVTKGVFDSE